MAGERYAEEFKITAVKQITQGGCSVSDVAMRLGITTKSLYQQRERFGENATEHQARQASSEETRRLKAERTGHFL